MILNENASVIFEKNGFFDCLNEPLFIGETEKEIGEEPWRNMYTFFLDDDEKEIITPADLKIYIDSLRDIKKKELLKRGVKRTIVFRVWHDTMDNWLRYNFLSKNDIEIAGMLGNPYLTFVDDVEKVFEAFLADRQVNRAPLIVPEEDCICPLEVLTEQEKTGNISKEFLIGQAEENDDDDGGENYTSYQEILNESMN